jgi:hypothetical protein
VLDEAFRLNKELVVEIINKFFEVTFIGLDALAENFVALSRHSNFVVV